MPTYLLAALLLLSAPVTASRPAAAAANALRPAHEALARGDTTAAVHWLTRACHGMDGPGGYLLLGQVLRARGTIESRLRSQRILEDAHARFPDDLGVSMELGRTYYAQRFFQDALACFNEVLARNPRNCDARYMVGLYYFQNWKRMNEFGDDLDDARRELRAAAACDTTNADAAFKYLVARYVMADTSSAECTRMLRRFPDHAEFWLYRGAIAYDVGRYADCARDFARGLALLDPTTREDYGLVGHVLPIDDRNRIDSFPTRERETVTRAYWIRSDPDPTTQLNELELEHIQRMFLGDALYSSGPMQKRGWETDRGRAFIKFGKPMSVSYTLGDDNRSGKVEIWSYVIEGVFQQYLFVDEFLNGNPRIPYSADVLLHYMVHAPRQTAFSPTAIPVPGSLDIVAFRDDGMSASVYLAMRIDADSLRAAADLSSTDRFVVRTAWFDPSWRRVGGSEDSVWTSEVGTRRVGGANRFDLVRHARVPFDRFHFAAAFEVRGGAARARLRGDADAARFVGSHLTLSDILLTAESGVAGAAIRRGDEWLWPRVDRRYESGQMLRAYVEIYNLSRVARATAYEVRYAIYPGMDEGAPAWLDWGRRVGDLLGFADGDPAIAQTFTRTGDAHDERESIGIDIAKLAPGRYELVIEVTDAHSGARAVAHTPFHRDAERVAEER